jgi:hypothetical protein
VDAGVRNRTLEQESERAMVSERTSYPYHGYTITTLLDDGVWWATVRAAEKDAGGDKPVLGGPWGTRVYARNAAQAFCDSRPRPDVETPTR